MCVCPLTNRHWDAEDEDEDEEEEEEMRGLERIGKNVLWRTTGGSRKVQTR